MSPKPDAPAPLILVVFGATGDLAERKLFPSLAALAQRGALPRQFGLVGVARRALSDAEFQEHCRVAAKDAGGTQWDEATATFRYLPGDYTDPSTFTRLEGICAELDQAQHTAGNRLYYLATVPAMFAVVAAGLAAVGMNAPAAGGSFARLVVEKPLGTDLSSAIALDSALHLHFSEDQVFRIDHYMGKETVLNVMALRFANAIFEPIWNRRYVDHVQITVAEDIGIEHRGAFYEAAGALRDIVQNHVMQVLALTMMEPPASMRADPIRDEKVKLLRSVVIADSDRVAETVVRGQYTRGKVAGEEVVAYRAEEGVDPHSTTETFVALELHIDNWRWAGVPVFVRAGKRLARRATEVAMVFQRPPHLPFANALTRDLGPDALLLRIQPDEGISLCFGAKVPGPDFAIRSVAMDFSYAETFATTGGDAYERLLLDAMLGDPTLFIRTDEVDQAWKIVAPIQAAIADDTLPVARYAAGSWGPSESDRLIASTGHQWLNP